MHPILFFVPVWLFAAFAGGALGASFSGKNWKLNLLCGALGALLAGWLARQFYSGGQQPIPVQSYGVMVLTGFILAVLLAEWRMPQIGVRRFHVLDMGLTGIVLGLLGARLFYIVMTWSEFNPFTPQGFDASMLVKMFKLWEGGLVFYGAFVVSILWTWYYCARHKLPAVPFLDIAAPGLLMGLAFGRIGCFLSGCCFGRTCELPWAVSFPKDSPAYIEQFKLGMLQARAAATLPVHPTQLYASLAAILTYAFLMLYWPRRKYDGQVLSLMLLMAGVTRFFEEILRADDVPPFPKLSQSWTIAQWVAVLIVAMGFGLMFFFRKQNRLYRPAD